MLRKLLLGLIGFTLLISCSPKIDQKKDEDINNIDKNKFEHLYRAGKKIEAGINVGINYYEFGKLLQDLVTEISIIKDKDTSNLEKELLNKYIEAFEAFRASSIVWDNKIESSQNEWVPAGYIEITYKTKPIITRYSLRTESQKNKNHPSSLGYGTTSIVLPGNTVSVLWDIGLKHFRIANKLYATGK